MVLLEMSVNSWSVVLHRKVVIWFPVFKEAAKKSSSVIKLSLILLHCEDTTHYTERITKLQA